MSARERPDRAEQEDVGTTTLIDQKLEDRLFKAVFAHTRLLPLVVEQLTKENFSSSVKSLVWEALQKYWQTYQEAPTEDTFLLDVAQNYGEQSLPQIERYLAKIAKLPVPEWGWIVGKLDRVVKEIRWRKTLYESDLLLQDGQLEEAEHKVVKTLRTAGLLQAGATNILTLSEEEIRQVVTEDDEFCCPTRITGLDKVIRGLYRKQLAVIMAPLNVGKTWQTVHLAVSANLSGKAVLYISGEMAKEKVISRTIQNVSGLASPERSDQKVRSIELWTEDFTKRETVTIPTLLDAKAGKKYLRNLERYGGVYSVKEYPSGQLTVADLNRELAIFDATYDRPVDVLIVDGLMDMKEAQASDRDRRASIGLLVRDLRGIAAANNLAMVVTHQGNRDSLNAEIVEAGHSSEALAIMQVCDTAWSLNQSRAEYQQGKMRIYIMRARNKAKWVQIELFQTLDIGQFCHVSRIVETPTEDADSGTSSGSFRERLQKRRQDK